MISAACSFLTAILPVAIVILPVLIAAFVIASALKMALGMAPNGGASHEAVLRVVGVVRRFSLTALGLIFAFMLITTSLAGFQAQRDFDAFRDPHRR